MTQPPSPSAAHEGPTDASAVTPAPACVRGVVTRWRTRVKWMFGRDEPAVAVPAAGVAAILLGATLMLGLSMWQGQQTAAHRERVAEVVAMADTLAAAAGRMLEEGDAAGVRKLVADAGVHYEMVQLKLELNNGLRLADLNPSHIDTLDPPDAWGAAGVDPEPRVEGDLVRVQRLVSVPGRGQAVLHAAGSIAPAEPAAWEPLLGLLGVAGVTLAGLWLVYRHARRRISTLAAIREALHELARDDAVEQSLTLSTRFGEEATLWNTLLHGGQLRRRDAVVEQLDQKPGHAHGSGGLISHACDMLKSGMVVVDPRGQVTYANGAGSVFLNTRRDELLGQPLADRFHDPKLAAALQAALDEGQRRRSTLEIDRDGPLTADADHRDPANATTLGTGVLRYSIRPLRAQDGGGAVIVIDDVTQQRVAEESRNTFVAQATHELRTPLTNIRLYVETALEEGEHDASLRGRCLNVINAESKRLEAMVSDMLQVSQIEAGSLELDTGDVRLETLLPELETIYRAQAQEKHIDFSMNLPPKLPVLQGDREKLAMALHNLIGNAMKYTPERGRVTVNIESDGNLQVEVIDSGIGIAEADARKVFDKFYRANDERVGKITGSGLGLALAREVVRLHGGDITLESRLNQGSTFTLTIPIHEAAAV